MATVITQAKSAKELNDILALRFRVLEESGRQPAQMFQFTRKLVDPVDLFPNTINVVAYNNAAAVACLRASEYSALEPIQNIGFNFQEATENLKGVCFVVDMLAMLKDFAGNHLLRKQIFRMILILMARRKLSFALCLCPEELIESLTEIGFQALQDPFESQELGQRVVPMSIKLRDFYSQFIQNISDQEIIRFQEVFYMSIFEPGEILVVQGEKGSTAYLIEEGEVEVAVQGTSEVLALSSIGKGHLIGEIAMVTNEPRTASLIAKTHTSCISFDRIDFMKLMYAEPHRSMDIFKIFSKRLQESNRKIAEIQKDL